MATWVSEVSGMKVCEIKLFECFFYIPSEKKNYCWTVRSDICRVHSPTNALFYF